MTRAVGDGDGFSFSRGYEGLTACAGEGVGPALDGGVGFGTGLREDFVRHWMGLDFEGFGLLGLWLWLCHGVVVLILVNSCEYDI